MQVAAGQPAAVTGAAVAPEDGGPLATIHASAPRTSVLVRNTAQLERRSERAVGSPFRLRGLALPCCGTAGVSQAQVTGVRLTHTKHPEALMAAGIRLLVVHGIGGRAQGATVKAWAEGLAEWYRCAPGVDVSISGTDLVGPKPKSVVTVTKGSKSAYVQLVEVNWATAFPQAKPGRVLWWLLWQAPALTVEQAGGCVAAVSRVLAGETFGTVKAIGWGVSTVLPLLVGLSLLVFAAPLALLGVVLLLLGSVVPIPALKTQVTQVLGWLTATVGSSFLFLADDVAADAMVERVREVIEEARDGLGDDEVLVVLAHSQGAAVAYQAIAALHEVQRPHVLVTVGSALGRLQDPRVTAGNGLRLWLSGLLVLAAVSGVWCDEWWRAGSLVGLLAATVATVWLRSRLLGALVDQPPLITGVWHDVWAGSDLVPNGPCRPSGSGYEFIHVRGETSPVRDHTSYARDLSGTLPQLVKTLHDEGRLRLTWDDLATRRREEPWLFTWKCLIPAVARFAVLVATVVALRRTDVFEWGVWAQTWLPEEILDAVRGLLTPLGTLLELPGLSRFPRPAVESATGAVALGLVGTGITSALVHVDVRLHRRSWRRQSPAGQPHPASVTVSVVAALLLIGLARNAESLRPPWTADLVRAAYVQALVDADATRLCHLLDTDAQRVLADALSRSGGCVGVADHLLEALCSDARSALETASPDTIRGASTWSPEAPPTCPSSRDYLLLLPDGTDTSQGTITALCRAAPHGGGVTLAAQLVAEC